LRPFNLLNNYKKIFTFLKMASNSSDLDEFSGSENE
jgi:hypothetical protein